jgi:RNA ligase (TIGR02306 family)
MRKLASIQQVINLIPIPNADAIELAQINGWQCVVKKGELQVGGVGVYFEIDAVPPENPVFAFLWKGHDQRPAFFRIKTIKLRGALSQGLLLPISFFPECSELEVGSDVTEILGVTKYEPPCLFDNAGCRGAFPSLVPKTDETRIQSAPQLIEELRGKPYVVTLKCDGSSSTFCMWDDSFHVCSRNQSVTESDNVFWRVARLYNLPEVMALHPHLALQGEVVGPGIQSNRMGLKSVDFRAFNLYDMRAGRYLNHDDFMEFCEINNIPFAPLVEEGGSFEYTVEGLLKLAEGKYEGTSNEREGIVIRPREVLYSPTLVGRLSFKAINNRYLLKCED